MKTIKRFLFVLLLSICVLQGMNAQSQLIHYWHFNNTLPASDSGGVLYPVVFSDYSALAKAWISFQKLPGTVLDTSKADNISGDTINQRPGYGGCCGKANSAIQIHNPCDSMEYLWYIPTVHYRNIKITFETHSGLRASSPRYQIYDYSLDSGLTFVNNGLSSVFDSVGTAWGKISLNLQHDSLTNNNAQLIFRVQFTPNNVGAIGTNSFDNITVEGDSMFCKAPVPVITQVGYVLHSTPAYAYQWCENGKVIPGATAQTYTVTTAGNYYVIITAVSGCKANSNTIVVVPTDASSLSKELSVSINPNPVVQGVANLEFASVPEGTVSYQVYSVTGEVVWRSVEEHIPSGHHLMTMDLSRLSPGMYFCDIRAGAGLRTILKLIVSNH
jgi:hypothetical protein